MELIPGLIDEMARECLIRVPFDGFPSIFSVCRAWSHELQQPEFLRQRKSSGLTRPIIILAQASAATTEPQNSNLNKSPTGSQLPTYWLTAFEPESGSWTRLPPATPWLPNGLPVFTGLACCGSELAVIGGWDPVTWQVCKSVYIFDFFNGRWRRGADMPGAERSLFGCAADSSRKILIVAGGHDKEKRALRSAVAYHLPSDTWMSLPDDMSTERDECTVISCAGGFRVIGGYMTETQGCFQKSAEVLDPDTWQWGPVDDDFLKANDVGLRCCVVGGDGELYAYQGMTRTIVVWRGDRWQAVAEVVDDLSLVHHIAVLKRSKLLVIGSSEAGGVQSGGAWVYDVERREWSKLDGSSSTGEYCGHVQAGCAMEL